MDDQIIIQEWRDPIFEQADIRVSIFRLDKLHPVISGNKWLKIKGYIELALKHGKDGLLTKGGPWSNHVHACAYACKVFQLPCKLWIKGNASYRTATLNDCKDWGAEITFLNRTTFYDEAAAREFAEQNNLIYAPMGGADQTGQDSIHNYLSTLSLSSFSHAVCAVGTATTFGGFACTANNFPNIIGIESGTRDAEVSEKIAAWQRSLPQKELRLIEDYAFGGFSKYSPELVLFMNDLYRQTGISTDIVYTGKLFYAVKHLAAASWFSKQSSLLIIHSGGLQGNRSLPPSVLQF